MTPRTAPRAAATQPAVVTKALVRAAERLGLSNRVVSDVLGVSEATVSRMGAGTYELVPGSKPFELAVLFIRMFRGLDAVVGGDRDVARAWLRNQHTTLGAAPLTLIASVAGLVHVVAYLDSRRALV